MTDPDLRRLADLALVIDHLEARGLHITAACEALYRERERVLARVTAPEPAEPPKAAPVRPAAVPPPEKAPERPRKGRN